MNQTRKFKLHIPPKITRRIIIIVPAIITLYLLLMISLSIYASSSKEKIISFVNARLKETIFGELKIDNAEITVWQTFPRLGIALENVTLSDSFYHHPFLKAGSITAKLGFLDLIGNKLKIKSVKLEDANIYTFTDAKGYTNSYILKEQNKDKRKSKKPLILKNIELENVNIISEDIPKNKRYEITVNDAEADISIRGTKRYITLDEDVFIRGLGFNLSKGYWLENQRVKAKWKMEFDTSTKTLAFKNTKVKIEDQPFIISGAFYLNDHAHFHLDVSTKEIPYKAALAILKPTTSIKLQKINLTGPLNVKAVLDGPMAYKTTPLIKADFSTADNSLNTPVTDFSDCKFSGSYINQVNSSFPTSDSNSSVNINAFNCNWGDIELKAQNIAITNLIQPVIRFNFFSECTLPQLNEQLSLSTLRFADGNAKLSLAYNGALIADPSLLGRLDANIQVQNGKVEYIPRGLTFSECNGIIKITSNSLLMKDFHCNLNTNHFVVNITGENLNRISDKETGKATINCKVFTPALDLSDFKALFAKKTIQTVKKTNKRLAATANSIDNAVENGDLFINVNARRLSLHNFIASNVGADILFNADGWEIKQASLQNADGNFNLTAKVHQVNDTSHAASAQISLQHIDVKKLFYGFDNFGQTGITYNNIEGVVDAQANINTVINNSGKFITKAMNGSIDFSLKNAALINLESLRNIQKYIFKNRNLDYVQFADLKNNFQIKNGDIYIPRMPIQSSVITMYVDGIYSFEDRTDISIQVPLSSLQSKQDGDYKKIDQAAANHPGPSIYLRARDKNGQVKIGLDASKKHRKGKRKKPLKDSL